MCVLDDVCAQLHSQTDGADTKFIEKLNAQIGSHAHLTCFSGGFTVTHYAGDVTYESTGFCERNRDVLFPDIIELMQSSSEYVKFHVVDAHALHSPFLVSLFPESAHPVDKHGRQKKAATASGKIKKQSNELVGKLMACSPHYIRCMKPNETKRAHDWDKQRCEP